VSAYTNSPEVSAAVANSCHVTRMNSEVASLSAAAGTPAGSVHVGGHNLAGSMSVAAPSGSSSGGQTRALHDQGAAAEQQPAALRRMHSERSSIRITPVRYRPPGRMDSVEVPTMPTKKCCGSVQDRSSPAQPSSPVQTNGWQHVGTPSPQPARYLLYLLSAEKPSAPATGSASPSLTSLSEAQHPFSSTPHQVLGQGLVRSAPASHFAAAAAQATHFVRLQGPTTPVARSAFYTAALSGLGSGRGMQCFSSGGTPLLTFLASPGGFPLGRPAPHIVTPAPAPPPLPFGSLTPVHRQGNPSHGMTPGPSSTGGEPANLPDCHDCSEREYTSACMAEWRHGSS